jgi:hypothetical protein
MVSRRSAEAVLALVLFLSLFLKVSGFTNAQTADDARVQSRVASFLEQRGFEVAHNLPDEDLISLSAEKGSCRMLVGVLSPFGWHRAVVHELAPPEAKTVFVFDGVVYPDQPTLITRAAHYETRLLRYAGFNPPERPVLGIIGSPACELENSVDWGELAAIHP